LFWIVAHYVVIDLDGSGGGKVVDPKMILKTSTINNGTHRDAAEKQQKRKKMRRVTGVTKVRELPPSGPRRLKAEQPSTHTILVCQTKFLYAPNHQFQFSVVAPVPTRTIIIEVELNGNYRIYSS